jgi:hypothetical protein
MTALQFRGVLVLFIVLLVAYVAYDPNRAESGRRFEWMRQLPSFQRYALLFVLVAVLLAVPIGIIGMFFFLRWAAIAFLVAMTITELLRPGKQNTIEKILAYSVVGGEVLFFYLIFFGPAQALFR